MKKKNKKKTPLSHTNGGFEFVHERRNAAYHWEIIRNILRASMGKGISSAVVHITVGHAWRFLRGCGGGVGRWMGQ